MRNLNLRDFEVFPYEFVGIFSPISSQSMHNFFYCINVRVSRKGLFLEKNTQARLMHMSFTWMPFFPHSPTVCVQLQVQRKSACRQLKTKSPPGWSFCPAHNALHPAGRCHAGRWRLNKPCFMGMTAWVSSQRSIIEVQSCWWKRSHRSKLKYYTLESWSRALQQFERVAGIGIVWFWLYGPYMIPLTQLQFCFRSD